MNAKEKKARYMKFYLIRVKNNGGKKLGSKYGKRALIVTMSEFKRRFMVSENG